MARRSLLLITVAGVALSACSTQPVMDASESATAAAPSSTSSGAPSSPTASAGTPSAPPTAPAGTMTPAPGSTGVSPSTIVRVTAPQGSSLVAVAAATSTGRPLAGTVKDGVWTASSGLLPGAGYTVTIRTAAADGTPSTTTSTFTVAKPAVVATYHVIYNDQTVGVGAPVTLQFDSPVATKEQRAEIEKHALVTTTPAVEGSWGWLDNRQLMWRPAQFWNPGTKVSLVANIQGLETGPGKFVGRNATGTFTVGPAMISTVDIAQHTMTVTRDGKVIKTLPISAGRSSEERYITRSGTKVIIEKNGDMTMDSATVGIKKGEPGYYKVDTRYNLRVTWTGEFLHAAPWSLGAQGRANVTHGCVNLSPKNAAWMFENSNVGDVVKFVGSTRKFLPTEGIGVWEYSYDAWKKQSALS